MSISGIAEVISVRERPGREARAGWRGRRRPFRRGRSSRAKAGAGTSAGRRIARPSARENSALVTGCGAVTLTGPLTAGVSTIQRTISIQSSRWTQGMYWRPDPIGPPAKKRNGRIICGSTPPDFSSTSPVRSSTTRTRGAGARCASRLPLDAQVRQEVVARRRALGERLLAAIAVITDAAGADERSPGGSTASRQGRHQRSGREDPAVAQRLLARGRPAAAGDGLAGEIDHRGGALELPGEAARMSVGGPADTGDAGFAGPGLVLRLSRGKRPGQHADVVALLGPRPGEGVAEKPGAAGDDHFHCVCWTCGAMRKFAGAGAL